MCVSHKLITTVRYHLIDWHAVFTRASTSRYLNLIRNLAALIYITVGFSGLFALSTQSVEAKTSRNSSHRFRNYFVPPPPPYTASLVPPDMFMTNPQAVTADADYAVVEKFVEAKILRPNSRRAGNYFVPAPRPYTPSMSALAMTNGQAATAHADDAVLEKPDNVFSKLISKRLETRIQKEIEDFDSAISSQEKEIGKLLNL